MKIAKYFSRNSQWSNGAEIGAGMGQILKKILESLVLHRHDLVNVRLDGLLERVHFGIAADLDEDGFLVCRGD